MLLRMVLSVVLLVFDLFACFRLTWSCSPKERGLAVLLALAWVRSGWGGRWVGGWVGWLLGWLGFSKASQLLFATSRGCQGSDPSGSGT